MGGKKTIRTLLDHVEIVEAPDDASPTGQLMNIVEEFCLSQAQARTREELLLGKPFTEDNITHFRSSDLLKFLQQRRFTDINTASKVWKCIKRKRRRK